MSAQRPPKTPVTDRPMDLDGAMEVADALLRGKKLSKRERAAVEELRQLANDDSRGLAIAREGLRQVAIDVSFGGRTV